MVWMCGLDILIFQRLKKHRDNKRRKNKHKQHKKIIIKSEQIDITNSNPFIIGIFQIIYKLLH